MSTDWERYSTPSETKERSPAPEDHGVVRLLVRGVRNLPGQTVCHRPEPQNRAHTDVLGPKDEEVRLKLARLSTWALIPPK